MHVDMALETRLDLLPVARSTHRAVVWIATIGALACSVVYLIAWVMTGDIGLLVEGTGPFAATAVFAMQLVLKKENAVVTVAAGAVVVAVTFSVVGTPESSVAAVVSLWVFAVSGSFFIIRSIPTFLGITAIVLAVVPFLWTDRITSPLAVGLTLFVAFLITSVLILAIRLGSAKSESRYRGLFNAAPVALLELEWSDAIAHLTSMGVETEQDLVRALQDRTAITEIVSRVHVVQTNAKARQIMGLSPGQHVAALPSDRVHDTSMEAFRQQILAVWQGRPRFEMEYLTHSYSDERSPMWVRSELVSTDIDDHSTRIMISITDITQLKEAQSGLEEIVRSKDEFIASISHELRTPLTGVMGLSAALLEGHVTDEEERRALLEVVVKQSEEVSYLVEDLLVGARADIGTIAIRPSELDLVSEAEEVFRGLGREIPIEVRSEGLAWADPVRVRQIIRNLAVNSQRYGGDRQRAVISGEGDEVFFDMCDNGEAIPDSARERIFQPYGRAHEGSGTTESVGLGLAVSRQLAVLMGGTLEYFYDSGSVFRLTLPRSVTTSIEPRLERVDAI